MNTEEIKNKPAAFAHEAIYDAVRKILKNEKRGVLLDVPAGEGALALRLKELGFDVRCCDLYTEIFKLKDTEIKRGNLDGKLPYENESFDYVVCVEGLEHIENPGNAVREFSRILRSGGQLIASTPNILNVEERLKWLFNGYTSHFKPLSEEVIAEIRREFGSMEEIALHINPIGYSELRYHLEKNNFRLEKVYLDKRKKNTWAYFPLIGLIKLAARLTPEKKRHSRWTNELNSKEVLLGGNTLIMHAKKL